MSNCSVVTHLPISKKLLDKNFDSGPHFWAMGAQKWPKFQHFCFGSQRLQIFRRYSYQLYEIIYAINFGVGTHLWVPGTLKVGPNCPNFNFFIFGCSGLKFSRFSRICYMKLSVQYFWAQGSTWVPRDYRNWSTLVKFFLFLSLVIEA